MSWIDGYADGAQQAQYHRNSLEECGQAVRLVCSYAHDADDARELCTLLGLNPRDGRRKDMPPTSPIPGRPLIRAPLRQPSAANRGHPQGVSLEHDVTKTQSLDEERMEPLGVGQ